MTDPILKPVSALAPAGPLTGAELVPVVQGGASMRATVQQIADLAASSAIGSAAAWRPFPLIGATNWALPQAAPPASVLSCMGPLPSPRHAIAAPAAAFSSSTAGVKS